MKILFVGGTGSVSTASSKHAVELGHELWVLNRGSRNHRLPKGVHVLTGDAYNPDEELARILSSAKWDCVVNWTIYNKEQAELDIRRFKGNTKHYVYISSTSVYANTVPSQPITEQHPYTDGKWIYSRAKIEGEERFLKAMCEDSFPATIVRPGHTYTDFTVPTNIQGYGYALIQAIRHKGRILVHDEGNTQWTLTHSDDFAQGLLGLLGKQEAIGQTCHITSPFAYTWNEIFDIFEDTLGSRAKRIYVPAARILNANPLIGEPIAYDKALTRVFSNSKIQSLVPAFAPVIDFRTGLERILRWHKEHPDQIRINPQIENELDDLFIHMEKAA